MEYTMKQSPYDYIIAEGHQDIFELTIRRARGDKAPLRDGQLRRFLTAGVNVVFIIVGGDATHHRDGSERPLEGSLDIVDMFLLETDPEGNPFYLVTLLRLSSPKRTSPANPIPSASGS